jgi:hypothetical protein
MEDPGKTIQVWRHPLKQGEVPYHMSHVHYGFDDVKNSVIRPGTVVSSTDKYGWVCWEIPDNLQNRRLVREGWPASFYTVITSDHMADAEKILAGARKAYASKMGVDNNVALHLPKAPKVTPLVEEAPAPAEEEVSMPEMPAPRAMATPRRG